MSVPDEQIAELLRRDDVRLAAEWEALQHRIERQFGRTAGIEAILFLIGVQSRGQGYEPGLEKEAKQDLIMEGTYCAFESIGLYDRSGGEEDRHWVRTGTVVPEMALPDQEKLLRIAILTYFEESEGYRPGAR